MRWIDSAMFSQEPLSGVYKAITPWLNSHNTSAGVKCPLRLSHTSSRRSAGKRAGRMMRIFSPCLTRIQVTLTAHGRQVLQIQVCLRKACARFLQGGPLSWVDKRDAALPRTYRVLCKPTQPRFCALEQQG